METRRKRRELAFPTRYIFYTKKNEWQNAQPRSTVKKDSLIRSVLPQRPRDVHYLAAVLRIDIRRDNTKVNLQAKGEKDEYFTI